MTFIPRHPIILGLRPRHAGDTTASLPAPTMVKPRNLGNFHHPALLQRTRRGGTMFSAKNGPNRGPETKSACPWRGLVGVVGFEPTT